MKNYDEWTKDELWNQVQMNFAAHMLIMYSFLREEGIEPDKFTYYVADKVSPSWKGTVDSVEDFMKAVLLNVVANGGRVKEVKHSDTESRSVVSQLMERKILGYFDLGADDSDQLWNKFIPIADSLGMIFRWEKHPEGDIKISVTRKDA